MLRYDNVRSTAQTVMPLETDEYHVYINNGITAINEDYFTGFEISEQLIYSKDEYIALISTENAELKKRNEDVEDTVSSILTDIIPNLLCT